MGCYDFSNKVALISGGSSGIGETLARQLAEHGCAVAVVASSTMNKAKTVADDITALGGRAVGLVGDVTDPAVCAHLVAQTQSEFGRLDILVNAAGVFKPSPAGATPTDDFNAMVDVNLKGTWNMISAVVDVMKAAGGGKILNFSSCAGVQALKGFAIYSATKAAISMMTRSLGADLAPDNINVNAIAPGNTATPMNAHVREDEDALAYMAGITPSNTTFSDPEEIAHAALYLVSDAARPIYGATLLIDEGISATVG